MTGVYVRSLIKAPFCEKSSNLREFCSCAAVGLQGSPHSLKSPEELYLKPGISNVYCAWKNSTSWRSILSRSLNHSTFDSLLCVKLISHDCENDKPAVNHELVQDLLLQLDPSKCVGPDWIHPRVLKELAGVITRPLLVISESWQSGEVPVYWKLTNIVFTFSRRARGMTMQTTGLSVST